MKSKRARVVADTMALAHQARTFLTEAHRAGHRGELMLRRYAMLRNRGRRLPGAYVTTAVLEAAIVLERADAADTELAEAAVVTLDDAARTVRVVE